MAMLRAAEAIEARKLRTRMILQVHDELVFEVPEAERAAVEPLVREAMEGAAKLTRAARRPPGLRPELGRREVTRGPFGRPGISCR